ncbi:putative DNA polymerase IV [Nitrospira sp. KM1]|nr:putative DNA polymerase IV [Nitrospira sp. KM1]
MSVDVAGRLCPALRIVLSDLWRLEAAHRELQSRIAYFAPVWESIRPGSLFLDLTGTTRLFGAPMDTATRIGREIMHMQGLDSVIGLGGSKLVAQLAATSLDRPTRILSVHAGSERSFLAPLPTMLLPGLHHVQASHIKRRLDDLNLRTFGSIADVSPDHLKSAFGSAAESLRNWALGIDSSPVRPPIAQPSIERSVDLTPGEVDYHYLLGRLYELSEQLCMALRQQRRTCRRLCLTIRHSDGNERIVRQFLPCATCWEADLQPVLTHLLIRGFRRRVRLRRMVLCADRLEFPHEQLSLFVSTAGTEPTAHHRLSLALDQIREKWGTGAISRGRTSR